MILCLAQKALNFLFACCRCRGLLKNNKIARYFYGKIKVNVLEYDRIQLMVEPTSVQEERLRSRHRFYCLRHASRSMNNLN